MKKRMAIICSTDYKSYPMGGMMSFIMDIVPHLAKHFDIDLWGVDVDGAGSKSFIQMGDHSYRFFSFGTTKVKQRKFVPNIIRVVASIAGKRTDILRKDYAVLYFHGVPLEFAFVGKSGRKAALVTHIHGVTNPFSTARLRWVNSGIVSSLYERYRRWVITKSDLVFLAADRPAYDRFKLSVPGETGAKITQIHNFADAELFYPMPKSKCRQELHIPPDDKVLVYTGRLSPQKDPVLLVNTFHQIRSLLEGVSLVIIGCGELIEQIRALATRLCLGDSVRFTGGLAREDICRWLNAADIFLYTSRGNGVPVSLVEALMCGLPIVTTDITGIHDLVIDGHTGLIAKSREPEEIAKTVVTALDRAEEMRPNCIKKSRDFTPQRAAQIVSERILSL